VFTEEHDFVGCGADVLESVSISLSASLLSLVWIVEWWRSSDGRCESVFDLIVDFVVFNEDLLGLRGFQNDFDYCFADNFNHLLEVVVLFSTVIVRLLLKCLKKSSIY